MALLGLDSSLQSKKEIQMQDVILSIPVKTNASVTPEEIAKVIQRLIDIGLADAVDTLEDSNNDGDVEAAQLAANLNIGTAVVSKPLFQYPSCSGPVTVYEGWIKHGGGRIPVGFQVPLGATEAVRDVAFVAALSKEVEIDLIAIGDSEHPLPEFVGN